MSIITGREYINRIDSLNSEVWVEGERVKGKLSENPAFTGIMRTKGKLYDMQHDPEFNDILTQTSKNDGGERYNFAFHCPKMTEDLTLRRIATQLWARECCGTVGRSPDYVNTAMMVLGHSTSFFSERFRANVEAVYQHAMKNDLSFTHTFINPQVNRSQSFLEYNFFGDQNKDDIIAAKIVDEKEGGMVIHGARLLATQGGLTDEILVLPTGGATIDTDYAYAFAIPSNTEGLKFLCREPYGKNKMSRFDHPLSSQFDEIDSVVVFDHVIVPWERVFIYKELDQAGNVFKNTHLNMFLLYQAVSRQVVKTEYILGIGEALADTIGITQYQHVQEKLSEMIMTLEIMRSLLFRAEVNGSLSKNNMMIPDPTALMTASNYYQRTYPRLVEILHLLGASGFISLPTEADFSSPISSDLNQYLQGKNANAEDRVQLFRFAWDLTMSPFGSRQTQYERFFFGDPVRLSSSLYMAYQKGELVDQVKRFLEQCQKE